MATNALSCSFVSATHASSATHAGIGNTRRNFLVALLWLIYRRGLRLLLIHSLTHFFTNGVAVLFFFSSVGDSRPIGNTCRHRRSNRRFFFLVNSHRSNQRPSFVDWTTNVLFVQMIFHSCNESIARSYRSGTLSRILLSFHRIDQTSTRHVPSIGMQPICSLSPLAHSRSSPYSQSFLQSFSDNDPSFVNRSPSISLIDRHRSSIGIARSSTPSSAWLSVTRRHGRIRFRG